MVEWIIAFSIPALIALLTMEPKWDRVYTFCGSIYLGTFAALAILPWTVSMLTGPMSPESPYMLLAAFFAVMVILTIFVYRIFCLLRTADGGVNYWSLFGAIPQRLLLFAGSSLFMGVLMISVSAVPLVDEIPGVSCMKLQKTGSRILMAALPTESVSRQEKVLSMLTNYPRHLNCSSKKSIKQKVAKSKGKSLASKTAEGVDAWNYSLFDTALKAKKKAQELQQRRERDIQMLQLL